MHQLLCFKSKKIYHFAFILGCYLVLLFLVQFVNVDVQYSFIYIVNYSCSLRCIEKNLVNYSSCGNC